MHNYLTIIPARKNSTRVKDKNLKFFYNKPLIEYTFDLVKKIKKLDLVLVSTDDKRIIKLTNKKKFLTPLVRPKKLARKNTLMNSVVRHALRWYKEKYKNEPKNIIVLQPTSPLRNYKEIKKAINLYEKKNYKSLISV